MWVSIDRFRSVFDGEFATVSADLSKDPAPVWAIACQDYLSRFAAAFETQPILVGTSIVAPVSPHEVAAAEAALQQVVDRTNWHVFDTFGDR